MSVWLSWNGVQWLCARKPTRGRQAFGTDPRHVAGGRGWNTLGGTRQVTRRPRKGRTRSRWASRTQVPVTQTAMPPQLIHPVLIPPVTPSPSLLFHHVLPRLFPSPRNAPPHSQQPRNSRSSPPSMPLRTARSPAHSASASTLTASSSPTPAPSPACPGS